VCKKRIKWAPLNDLFSLGELVFWVKVFRPFRLERSFLVFGVWTQYVDEQHLSSWQGQRVCDGALFFQASGFAGFGALNLFFQLS
jgi:hypothetical protein